jgi:hypothetical protein
MKKSRLLVGLWKACKWLVKRPADVLGYVERIEPDGIYGWSVHRKGQPLQLECRIDGAACAGQATWLERSDVAGQYRSQTLLCGFQFVPAAGAKSILREARANGRSIELLANGTLLKDIAERPVAAVPLQREPLAISRESDSWRVEIENWGHFTIQGRLAYATAAMPALAVYCHGESVTCAVAWQTQPAASGWQVRGFEIELPGYIWEGLAAGAGCAIEIRLDGQSVTPAALSLARAKAAAWISEIVHMGEGAGRQYRALLALEHIHYGDFLKQLASKEARFMREFAERINLAEYGLAEHSLLPESEWPVAPLASLKHWQALRLLNSRLADRRQPVTFAMVEAVVRELRLANDARELFLRSLIPALCRSGEFLRLRELWHFSLLQRIAAEDLAATTLVVPAMLADGHIGHACDAIYRLVKSPKRPLIHSECIDYSVKQVQRLASEQAIDNALAEKFRYAVVALLDSCAGGWFSRLHDQYLVSSMAVLLQGLDSYADYHRREMLAAAIRNYGLNPAFWDCLSGQNLLLVDEELVCAHGHFQRLRQCLSEPGAWAGCLADVVESLEYFSAKNNPEAAIFWREIAVAAVPSLNQALSPVGKALLARWLAIAPEESVRLAAYPVSEENRLLAAFAETSPKKLRDALYSLSDAGKSSNRYMQEAAAAALAELLAAHAQKDKAAISRALPALETRALPLAMAQRKFLAFDLLATAYQVAASHGLDGSFWLEWLLAILRKAVEETRADGHLPAPVAGGWQRLQALPPDTALLGHFLADGRKILAEKFGNRYSGTGGNWLLRLNSAGWPQDTLVVVYSCRKYLDSRVNAIRATWVQALKARQIPYVVLVGDGDDQLHGDVLALDVSDHYEDLPKKTLKLFDWVYRHSNAQYVLKIDDDCYLDVERYFDSLSYRKHHYYGRIIRREPGSMDRTWHQAKSHTPHSQKSLDKSPEPALYADGGGAYCLSRTAIEQLLASAKTLRGERLIACSFMEDKLVGDLLAANGIFPSNEDYESYQRRRTFGTAMPVGMWENTFFPCRSSLAKVVHLDRQEDLAPTLAKAGSGELWPKKLWPTYTAPSIKPASSQLELLGCPAAAAQLLRQELRVVTVLRDEMALLPHFLDHYRKLGVRCFIMVDNCSEDGSREYLHQQSDVLLYSADTAYPHAQNGLAWRQAVLGNLCLGRWVLLADVDEWLLCPDGHSLADVVAEIEAEGCNAAQVLRLGLYPEGDLAEADFARKNPWKVAGLHDKKPWSPWHLDSGMYSNSVVFQSNLRHRLAGLASPDAFPVQKYALFRYQPWLRLAKGLHDISNARVSPRRQTFAYFKYHAGFKQRLQTDIRRGHYAEIIAKYRTYAAALLRGEAGIADAKISMPFSPNYIADGFAGNILCADADK